MKMFLTPYDAAKLLHRSVRSLERDRQQGFGPPFLKYGRQILYRLDDIEAWACANTVQSTAEAETR